MYNLAYVLWNYNLAIVLILLRALAYTTLDKLLLVFFYIIFAVLLKFLINSIYQVWFQYF